MIKLHVEKGDLLSLLYETIKNNDMTIYTLLEIALEHISDVQIDNFVKEVVNRKSKLCKAAPNDA